MGEIQSAILGMQSPVRAGIEHTDWRVKAPESDSLPLDWQGLRPFASKKAGVFAGATEGAVTDSLKDCKLVGRVLIMRGIYRTPLLSYGFLVKT